VKAEIVKDFQTMIAILNQKPALPPPSNVRQLSKVWGWAVEFDITAARLIYFRKHWENKLVGKADKKGRWSGELSEGKLTDLEGNILTFDDHVDGVYFQNLDSLLITPPHSRFEEMFEFRDFYRKEATKALKALQGKFLIIEDELIPEAAESVRISQRITKLSKSGVFNDIESKKITTYFFEQTRKMIGEEITYDIFNGKVAVQDMKALQSFVDACMCRYLYAPAGYTKDDEPQLFVADYKHLFEKAKAA